MAHGTIGDQVFAFYLLRGTGTVADSTGRLRTVLELDEEPWRARISARRLFRALVLLHKRGLVCAEGCPAHLTPYTRVALMGDVTEADVYGREAYTDVDA